MMDLFLWLIFHFAEGASPKRPNRNGRKSGKKYPRKKGKVGRYQPPPRETTPIGRRPGHLAVLTRKLMAVLNHPITWWVFLGLVLVISLYLFYYIIKTGGISPENRRRYKRDQKRRMQFESISNSPNVNRSPINAPVKSIFRRSQPNDNKLL